MAQMEIDRRRRDEDERAMRVSEEAEEEEKEVSQFDTDGRCFCHSSPPSSFFFNVNFNFTTSALRLHFIQKHKPTASKAAKQRQQQQRDSKLHRHKSSASSAPLVLSFCYWCRLAAAEERESHARDENQAKQPLAGPQGIRGCSSSSRTSYINASGPLLKPSLIQDISAGRNRPIYSSSSSSQSDIHSFISLATQKGKDGDKNAGNKQQNLPAGKKKKIQSKRVTNDGIYRLLLQTQPTPAFATILGPCCSLHTDAERSFTMLAAPSNNPVRRLSSFFSLGSPKPDDKRSPTKSPHLQSSRSSSLNTPPIRDQQLAEETQALSLNPRNVSAPVLGENAHQAYTPPPRLSSLNPDLAGPGSPDAHSRSQSLSDAVPRFNRPGSRPGSGLGVSGVNVNPTPATITKAKKAAKSKKSGHDAPNGGKRAWIAGTENDIPYDISNLLAGERVTDLWDDAGDTYVYLFPQNSGRPPSFKVDSAIFSASASLTLLARGNPSPPQSTRGGRNRAQDPNSSSPPLSAQNGSSYDGGSDGQSQDGFLDDESQELHLYLPVPLAGDLPCGRELPVLSAEDVDMLVLFRNLFAFLIGQALIATPRTPSIFTIFMEVSGLLDRFGFTNLDQSTFGETATTSFGCYCDELDLIDVRASRERALDAIILGERMKYLPLYQEGFTHGVAVLDDLKKFEAKYNSVSPVTRKRLERGYLDLDNRIKTCAVKIDEFEFPSLFAGIANSNVANEAKVIRFKNWKNAYLGYRKNVVNYYRARFGSWPPKASKKNQFQESGLNRLVLRELYQDFCDLYDMLADRTDLTTRSADMTTSVFKAEDSNSTSQALRQIMSEYDRSTPPVQPPIPFDIPRLPSIHSIRRKLDPKQEAKQRSKRLTTGEVNEILVSSYNHASMKPTPFLENFMNYERRVGHGKCADELADMRCAQWLFMYAVIQSLPMLVVDAPDLRCTHGVEYFLCIPPWGGSPWCASDPKNGKKWFGVAGGSGVQTVSMLSIGAVTVGKLP
ncbi:hypothetical protein MGYG_07103 [Nannizzia gypsea CBS 118893]|uniref:DUF8004 domain-containing protein n=1 Tax=Arthroderma gypseum (strain ATCC MYA-4604 / CBS 118893) TaxID=535722 RepID=E4V231_ARTGP|nr:hypothetical protein MGYG_07103 [Nannizzia gypsea CBS 118893]EFR04096.1 hypothetical protein MGYG_07103 [Nannizzia gypsea CBS 118893]